MRLRRIGTASLAALIAAGLAGCGGGKTEAVAPAPSPTASASTEPVENPTAGPSESPSPDPSAMATTSSGPWKLVFSDDFDGTSLKPVWASRPTSAAAGRTCASTVPEMAKVADGYARFSIAPDPNGPAVDPKICPSGRYFNAQFGTQGQKSFLYGKFEARIKYQHAEGMHGSFWLQTVGPVPGAALDDPAQTGTEADVTEYFGDDFGPGEGNGDAYAFVYWPQRQADGSIKQIKTGGAQGYRKIHSASLPSDGYHVYTMEWTPDAYIFSIDGVETSRVTVGVSHRPEYPILSLLTSDWEIPKLLPENKNASMSVDWVRIYQH